MIKTQTSKEHSPPSSLDLGTSQLSYAAGSTSLDPFGFRMLGQSDQSRFGQLMEVFPELRNWISCESLVVNAYPAALGLAGFAPLVDTYMHPPTFIRSMRLAAIEQRTVLLAAQPLAGTDFLLRMLAAGYEIPHRMLWASGGYYFPSSLQEFIRDQLAAHQCELKVLHCYGAAEVGHTCFAALNRFDSGHPRYRHVATQIDANIAFASGQLVLSTSDQAIDTGDYAEYRDSQWKIENSPSRLSSAMHSELESWGSSQWENRTGYAGWHQESTQWQRREWVSPPKEQSELSFFRFWESHGGSFQTKPIWKHSWSTHASVSCERTVLK